MPYGATRCNKLLHRKTKYGSFDQKKCRLFRSTPCLSQTPVGYLFNQGWLGLLGLLAELTCAVRSQPSEQWMSTLHFRTSWGTSFTTTKRSKSQAWHRWSRHKHGTAAVRSQSHGWPCLHIEKWHPWCRTWDVAKIGSGGAAPCAMGNRKLQPTATKGIEKICTKHHLASKTHWRTCIPNMHTSQQCSELCQVTSQSWQHLWTRILPAMILGIRI